MARSSTNRYSRPGYPKSAPSTLRARRGWRKEWPGAARALRWSCTCAAWPQLRERLLGNAEVLFGIEMAPYLAYEPTPGQLAAIRVPR
jgi:hypothetical protein